MRNVLTSGLLWFSALGCGQIAGLYFAFSAFIMTALGRIDQAAGISAMNAISVYILRSPFMPVFIGTTLSCAVLVVLGGLRWQEPGAIAMICGGVLYVLGMFIVTMVFNVPLNDQLAATAPARAAAAPVWARYLIDWTFWNHVRTVTSLAATAMFIVAIAAR